MKSEDFVTIYFEGLMICCFNSAKQRFETALIRRSNHDFSVRLVKYDGDTKVEDNTYLEIPSENVRFDIEGKGNPEVNGFRKFQAGTFKRLDENLNDPRDLRWLVDIEGEEFYNSKVEPTGESLSKYNMPLVPVYVKNAEFFVDKITVDKYEKVEDDENGNEISKEFFGKCGYLTGARINADSVSMDFGQTEIPTKDVERKEGFHYKVFITNTREGGDEQPELPVYYRVIKHSSGRQFNLDTVEDAEVELYTRMGNCSKLLLGQTETIEGFS